MEHNNYRGRARGQEFDFAPPCDIEAERAVLAAVLLEPCRISDVTAALEPNDFTDQVNRTIYAAMLRLQRRGLPPDATLLIGELRDGGQYNAEEGVSVATLVELFRLYPLVQQLPHYLDRVLEMSHRRRAVGQGV